MAFDIETDFFEVGSVNNSPNGGQTYSVTSDADTLGLMMVSGYLDALSAIVNVRDNIILSGTDGMQCVQVNSNSGGVVTVNQSSNTGIAAALSGAGAIPITARSVDVTSTGADATTLADGVVGQLLNVILIVDGGTMTMTPANALGYSTIAFADAGDSVQLEFKSGGWALIGQGGLGTGPLSA